MLKDGNLDKFEFRSSDGIFLGYASHSRAYRVLIIDTNIVRETCEVTFDETAPCNASVFEVAGEDELGTSIFEDEEEEAAEGDAEATTHVVDQSPPPRARTMMTAPILLCLLPGGQSSR